MVHIYVAVFFFFFNRSTKAAISKKTTRSFNLFQAWRDTAVVRCSWWWLFLCLPSDHISVDGHSNTNLVMIRSRILPGCVGTHMISLHDWRRLSPPVPSLGSIFSSCFALSVSMICSYFVYQVYSSAGTTNRHVFYPSVVSLLDPF